MRNLQTSLSTYFLLLSLDTVLVGFKRYNLIDVESPSGEDFIQLETITENKAYSRVIYNVQMNEEKSQIKLGRGHDSDLRIEDISVSRVHALIKKTSKGYLLQDNGSKFGTLYLLPPGPHEISATDGLFIQFGRTSLGLTVKEAGAEVKKSAIAICPVVSDAYPLML